MCSEMYEDMLHLEGMLYLKKVSVLIKNDIVYPCALCAQVCTQCAKRSYLKQSAFDEHTSAPGAQFVHTWAIVCNEQTEHTEHTLK